MESISVDELKKKVLDSNPIHIVDVRTNEETTMGVIPGATTIPMDQIHDNLNQFNKNETYYIICAAGRRSAKVVECLEERGIHAINVEGGMNEWGDKGTVVDNI
ncbi:rhodanese-like domain-containing protein [Staphylococcus saccharolyticus]|uniref:Rhodanese-like domain-containing protein n=1 Tax=Staphylococcus saccharolyticus TaxID=33028 RepID=A0A380H1X8_9STAP|nr:rhodanese-like domain-containing protein [Staphylococcus saccharolyticus]MBL7565006.1 rhodanese-like domain-containing protein [Staphylococcus saccharolyticus]MBL7571957.1 rhodanese-like domain-containing protein [Staphylococcus saccharolyticus]QQB98438.1 rhodanese-like domain-containing protein [Staphylococcus saccharolyticus]QRJ67346.1 rhodanese-like domain-containing protein [Staphylococcus saccharolyticus]RTX97797.1 rhodanese-like domain-containing protein [Staphylococcus saccharolyticu